MRLATVSILSVLLTSLAAPGCGGSQPPAEAPAEAGPSAEPAADPSAPTDGAPARSELTAEACEATGGTVVGDIGDGAIHKADYRCPSGAEPSGNIKAPEGGPMGVEGSVCCPK